MPRPRVPFAHRCSRPLRNTREPPPPTYPARFFVGDNRAAHDPGTSFSLAAVSGSCSIDEILRVSGRGLADRREKTKIYFFYLGMAMRRGIPGRRSEAGDKKSSCSVTYGRCAGWPESWFLHVSDVIWRETAALHVRNLSLCVSLSLFFSLFASFLFFFSCLSMFPMPGTAVVEKKRRSCHYFCFFQIKKERRS